MSKGPAIALVGGMDLVTPAPMAQPGTLSDCENYEVSTRSGYSRIDGWERFDGSDGVAEFRILRLTASATSGLLSVRDRVRFAPDVPALAHQGFDGYVVSTTTSGGSTFITVVFAGGMGDIVLPDQIEARDIVATADIVAAESLSIPLGQQADFDFALKALADARRAGIGQVPGRSGSDILGGFLFRNDAYAVRDLPRAYFEGGYYTDDEEGLFITINGASHEILFVQVLGEETGYVAYDPVAGSGVAATGIGSPVLVDLPVTGSFATGFLAVPYSDSLSVSGGTPPYTWVLAEDDTGATVPAEIGDLSTVTLQAEVTPAALWRSSDAGWVRVELGREMAFISGTDDLESTPRALDIDAGDIKNTGIVFTGDATLDGVALANVSADDGTTDALGGGDGQTLLCTGFDFSAIPDGAEILGVEVRIERQSNVGGKAVDDTVALVGVAGGTENKAGGDWDTALTVKSYGGSNDLWGSENLTAAAVKAAAFGVVVVVRRSNPANAIVATLDYVAIRVYYAERAGRPVFVWDGATDVPITLINVQVLSGAAGSYAGFLTIEADKNADKPRTIKSGDQIRTAASGGGTLIGIAASRDRPIFLPGQFEVDNNRSQYTWEQHNFFGQDRYSAMYGVSGAGPAMAFDGENLIKIRTPLSPGQDIPRHLTKHGDSLAMGYFSGAVILSAPGEPYEMRGDLGATAIETGDRLTALAPGGGDALIIACESRTIALRGFSAVTYSPQTISAKRGAIEYTMADPGRAIIADSFGLFAADTPESFEPASRNYLSALVEPWLRERLQATISNEQRFLRPVAALAVRSKNQYRMFFRDGAVLTMTMGAQGIEITKQRFYVAGDPDTPLPVRNVWSGIDSSGRERLFMAFTGAKEGYVFELDVGRSFDGEAIPAYVVLNPMAAGSISKLKRWDRLFFGGAAGHAELDWSSGIDGQEPTGALAQGDLGRATQPATAQNGSKRNFKLGSVDLPAEAYAIAYRVDSLTNLEAPHTLQYIETFVDVRGDSRGHRGD